MQTVLAGGDAFNLSRTPNFEPRRGPGVPGFVTGAHAPLLYMPVRSGPEAEVVQWLAGLDGVTPDTLSVKHTQKSLRQWKRGKKGHRSFTVIRHPVARAHAAFCNKILNRGPGTFTEIRKTLLNFYKVPLPGQVDDAYDRRAHREAFVGFLEFLKANLNGQTGIRVDANWATQAAAIQGMGVFALPDMIIRESEMASYLPALARQAGYVKTVKPSLASPYMPIALSDIYDNEIETLVREIYQRDYMMFGFRNWE
jgi:hypothetical protein